MGKELDVVGKGLVFVISAPAGTGKTTLVRMLREEYDSVVESISYTTRPIRKNEVPNVDYHYVSTDQFKHMIQEGDFLEYAKVFDHYYGTSRKYVESQQAAGKHVILVIDTQGGLQLMGACEAVFIFILPPSMDELRRRLTSRQSDSPESIEKRLAWAEEEISKSSRYDYRLVNDDLGTAYTVLKSILIAETHKTCRPRI